MKTIWRLFILLQSAFLLVSCSVAAPAVTVTPTPTGTSTPTLTPTPKPPAETPDVFAGLVPTGQPLPAWNGIPVMPGALSGDGDEASYRFTIAAAPVEVQVFYDRVLAGLGWSPFTAGQSENGALFLIYTQDQAMMTVSVIPGEGLLLVMLVK